jgi:hypothetical protein
MGNCYCGARWGGQRTEHCCTPGCHQTFSSTSAGDMHRTGDHAVTSGPTRRRCLTVGEMLEKGMNCTHNPHGVLIWTRGGAGYRGGVAPEAPIWATPQESEGLSGPEWGNVPPQTNEALTESEVSA